MRIQEVTVPVPGQGTGHPVPAPDEHLLTEIAQLRQAIESRDLIGQAKGIIRFLTQCDSEAAFILLSQLSQDTNRKLRDVAVLLADCAASGQPMPADLAASWRAHT